MNLIFQEIFAATFALTIAAYGSAIALSTQPNPNPDRTQVITSLTQTGDLGGKTIAGLLTLNLVRQAIARKQQ